MIHIDPTQRMGRGSIAMVMPADGHGWFFLDKMVL